ncbi:MAG: DUF1573 domain-containing protein [Phycisphaerales bacterium]|nr:MAG: DUF1573 domain-containing protein [Phycisphaerales bacterium]
MMSAYQKISLLVILISMFVLQAGCQQQTKVATTPETDVETGEPTIEFESLVYDFGKVGPGQKMVGEFKFTNTGDAPLRITKVQKCCGAVTKLDKENIAPGESGVLQVTYTSSRTAGAMTKRLYVSSNDETAPRAMLTIKAKTVLRVNYEPKSLKLLLKDENAACPKITLTSTDNQPFSITRFQSTGNAIMADFDSAVEATRFILEPKVNMEKVRKGRVGRINIGLVYSEPDTQPGTVSIMYQILSRFTVRPSTLVLLHSNPGQTSKKSLWITDNYGKDFEVESTVSKEGHIKVLDQTKVGNRHQFLLEITRPSDKDEQRFSDTFTINLKGGEVLEVPCRGIYRPWSPRKPAIRSGQ